MSILDEVLIEEYERCERIKAIYLEKLPNLSSEEQERQLSKIAEIEFDQKKIRAALDVAGIDINDHLKPLK